MAYKVISPIMNYFLANNMCKDYTDIEGENIALVQLNPSLSATFQEPLFFDSNTILDGENATITGIEFVNANQLIKTPSGQTTIDASYYANGLLTISDLKKQIIAQLPLTSLISQSNGGKIKFTFFNTHVWANCYVDFTASGITSPTIPLLFNVYYVPKIKN